MKGLIFDRYVRVPDGSGIRKRYYVKEAEGSLPMCLYIVDVKKGVTEMDCYGELVKFDEVVRDEFSVDAFARKHGLIFQVLYEFQFAELYNRHLEYVENRKKVNEWLNKAFDEHVKFCPSYDAERNAKALLRQAKAMVFSYYNSPIIGYIGEGNKLETFMLDMDSDIVTSTVGGTLEFNVRNDDDKGFLKYLGLWSTK